MNGSPVSKNAAEAWPPKPAERSLDSVPDVPYLRQIPDPIPIRTGRQLFVDDYLIERDGLHNLHRSFHAPVQSPAPVLYPQTGLELNGGWCPLACPFKDGLFYDDRAGKFRLWYHAGWFDGTSYAESRDGVHWERLPELIPGHDGRIVPRAENKLRDGAAVWLDYKAPPAERYKLFLYQREFSRPIRYFHEIDRPTDEYGTLYRSADGVHWEEVCRTGSCGDNTAFFYNPFRQKWAFSIRVQSALHQKIRARAYYETDDFFSGSRWTPEDLSFWGRTDRLDRADPRMEYLPQLYNLDAAPYESLMLGMYGVFLGPPNEICEQAHRPKIIDMKLAFSRDGFHWDRPCREPFLASSRVEGSWNYGYLHPAGGLCLVVGDELYIYYSAFSGRSPRFGMHMYAGGSMGLAKLRRDGFASLEDAGGSGGNLLTRPLVFEGNRLFVNADALGGAVRAELIDADSGSIVPGFTLDDCVPACANRTKQRLSWTGGDLGAWSGRRVRLRFSLQGAKLYSFWVSPKESGASMGYMAAGGPGFFEGRDCL